MYNALSSFNCYLRATILPQLGTGVNLYTENIEQLAYPCVSLEELEETTSDISGAHEITVRFYIDTEGYNVQQARLLLNKLLEKLNIKDDCPGGYTLILDYSNPITSGDPPVTTYNNTGKYVKWLLKRPWKRQKNNQSPELTRYTFDLTLLY